MADTDKASSAAARTKVVQGPVSFIQTTTTMRGRYLSTNHFAVEPKNYGDGWEDGRRCFNEYMRYLVGKGWCCGNLIEVVEELAVASREGNLKQEQLSRRGAAVGFLREMERVLVDAANSRAGHSYAHTREPASSQNKPMSARGHLRLVWSAPT